MLPSSRWTTFAYLRTLVNGGEIDVALARFRNRLMSEAEAVAFPAQALELRHTDPTLAPIGPERLIPARRANRPMPRFFDLLQDLEDRIVVGNAVWIEARPLR